jgi:hypothetical protein
MGATVTSSGAHSQTLSILPEAREQTLHFDHEQARRFLTLLGKEPADSWFRSLRSGKSNSTRRGADLQGFNHVALQADADAGLSLFLVIGNATKATRKAGAVSDADVSTIPALFVEWDDRPIEWQVSGWQELGLPEPSVMVATGGKSIHCYWTLEEPLPADQWRAVTRRLIDHCGSDPSCSNPSRVMRLPGSPYRDKATGKATGQACIVHESGHRYSLAAITACLPAAEPLLAATTSPSTTNCLPPRDLAEIQKAAAFIPKRIVGGNTYETCRRALCGCAAALAEIGQPESMALDLLAHKWPYRRTAEQALKSSTTREAKSFWAIAAEHGYSLRPGAQQPALIQEIRQPTLDDLLGSAEDGKLRRPRNDLLTRAVALVLPLRKNLLTNRIELDGEPIHGDYLNGLYLQLAEDQQLEVAKERAIDAAVRVARQNAYHPVQDYLNGLTDQLTPEEWAGIDLRCFGAEDPSGWGAVHLQRQLIGLVARALKPGCELHTCLVLQSDQQGIGKSTFWKLLGGPWFSDSLGDLREMREDRLQLHSAWIHEWGEIDNVMGKRESETLKRFLSCSRDDVRRPYGKGTEQLLRSCGLVGTTNRRDFIKDPTGNRRFPILQINSVNLDWVQTNRDRIWGSAIAAYRAGTPWHYSSAEGQLVSAQAMEFAAADPLRDRLESWAEDHPETDEVPLVRILWDLQSSNPDYWERRNDREFMRQMGLAMTALGWGAVPGPRVRYLLPDQTKTDKATLWKRAK